MNEDEEIIIILDRQNLDITTQQIYNSMLYYIDAWIEDNSVLPVRHSMYGSLSWNSANYTGTSQTNLFAAEFWNGYFDFANTDGLNADNSQISDFKIFFDRTDEGVMTNTLVAVYLQMGGQRAIYFSNGVVVTNTHYSAFYDSENFEIVYSAQ